MKLDPQTQNQHAYDQIVSTYAARNAKMQPYVLHAAERIIQAIHMQSDLPAFYLDLGCGAGRDMAWFDAQDLCLMGADLSLGMLREAKKVVTGDLFQLDMRYLPYVNASLGMIWCQAALLHLPKTQTPQALHEMNRVLASQGWLHVAVQKGETEGFETRPYEPTQRYYAHYQIEEISGLLETSGFKIKYLNEAQSRRPWISIEAQKR
ncbi:MAG: class I SAM-dependent methyltransferase [Anaerolineaceae bacterium]|nr:class I SAM-dependent methyltransferase [Anaerolineaceae bacterium]